jgi:hypothetical protein
MSSWWLGKLPIAETLIFLGLGRIVYQLVFAFTGWPISRNDFLISLAVTIFGFALRLRKLRYP